MYRKTGVTLRDTGVRDEYGLEPVEGIFSSPDKAPRRSITARRSDGRANTSESIDMDTATSKQSGFPPHPLFRSSQGH